MNSGQKSLILGAGRLTDLDWLWLDWLEPDDGRWTMDDIESTD